MDIKKKLRIKGQALRQELIDSKQHKILSEKIQNILLASHLYKNCETICLFASTRGEVETNLIADDAFSSGKSVFYPRCHPTEPGIMSYIKCQSFDDLQLGKYDILEPKGDVLAQKSELNNVSTLILVPAMLYDKHGIRLGYGQGYYDRLLADHKLAITVGLAFSAHIQDELPRMDWDIPAQYLANEFKIIETIN